DSFTWWVQALNVNGDQSGWSASSSFTVVRPAAPTPIAPIGTVSAGANNTLTLSWSGPSTATYDVLIDDLTANQSSFYRNSNIVNATSINVAFPTGHKFRWQVRIIGNGGDTSLFSTATFTISLGAPPVPIAPVDQTVNTKPAFSWNTVTGADLYDLWVDD